MPRELAVEAFAKLFEHGLPVDFDAICVSIEELRSEVTALNVVLAAEAVAPSSASAVAAFDDLDAEDKMFTMLSRLKNKVNL